MTALSRLPSGTVNPAKGGSESSVKAKETIVETLTRRVRHYVDIEPDAFEDLSTLPFKLESYRTGEDIIRVGDTVDNVFVIEQGWAIRYRRLEDGRRQILNFMLPGDCFDMMAVTAATADHSVAAATKLQLRRVNARDFLNAIRRNETLATAFWWSVVQEEAILREQIVRVGRRSARERVSHLLLELNRRIAAIEGELSDIIALPFPQALLGDALGLSVVHISRTLSWLRSEGLIGTTVDGIEIRDRDRLVQLADFNTAYLHLDRLTFDRG